MERKPKVYYDSDDESDFARPAFPRFKSKSARVVAKEISVQCKQARIERKVQSLGEGARQVQEVQQFLEGPAEECSAPAASTKQGEK